MPLHENPVDHTRYIHQRLKYKIKIRLSRWRIPLAIDHHPHRPAYIRLAACKYTVEQREKALIHHFGESLGEPLANHVAKTRQLQIGMVGDFKNMVRAAHDGNKSWRLAEQGLQAFLLGALMALGQHHGGCLGAGAIHARNGAAVVQNRRPGKREPGVFCITAPG